MDIGSSSVRAAIHDRRGRTVAGTTVQVPYAWDVAADDSVRLSHEVLLDVVGQVLDQVVEAAESLAPDIVAGGISCFLHSICGLDADGRPVTPVLSWADSTSRAEAAALREQIDPGRTHQITGVPIHASYWPARILRLRQEEPRIRQWSGLPGAAGRGPDRAPRGQPVDGVGDRTSRSGRGNLVDRAVGPPGHGARRPSPDRRRRGALGRLSDRQRRWPQLAHVSWFAPWGDGSCANVGMAATGPGRAGITVGTSGAMRTFIADPAPTLPIGLFAYRLGGGTVIGGQLSEGGGVLDWTSRLLGRRAARWSAPPPGCRPMGTGSPSCRTPSASEVRVPRPGAGGGDGLHADTDPAACIAPPSSRSPTGSPPSTTG